MVVRSLGVLMVVLAGLCLAACGQTDGGGIMPAMKPLSNDAMHLMSAKGLSPAAPIFIRIFKEESELEIWKAREDGHFYHFKTYPICNWSGDLGPKLEQGDRQAPEGFYTVSTSQLNPNSKFYLAFNVGFPNAYDKAFGRTGQAIMVHGDCRSAGCYAMTDALIEEIYAITREAFAGGQKQIALHAYPFRMTPENMARHKESKWHGFWRQLKEGYDYFELTRQPPPVAVCSKRYVVNARFNDPEADVNPAAPCPAFVRPTPQVWAEAEQPGAEVLAMRIRAPGPKTRNLEKERQLAQQQAPVGWGTTATLPQASALGYNLGSQ